MPTKEELDAIVEAIQTDSNLLHEIVHGAFNGPDVITEGGSVSPLAKVIASIQNQAISRKVNSTNIPSDGTGSLITNWDLSVSDLDLPSGSTGRTWLEVFITNISSDGKAFYEKRVFHLVNTVGDGIVSLNGSSGVLESSNTSPSPSELTINSITVNSGNLRIAVQNSRTDGTSLPIFFASTIISSIS